MAFKFSMTVVGSLMHGISAHAGIDGLGLDARSYIVCRQTQRKSVELSRQLSKQQALNLLLDNGRPYFYVTLALKTCLWLDHLGGVFFFTLP